MGSKPITYRSKSPLKAGEDGLLGKKKVVDANGNVLSADDSGKKTPASPAVPAKPGKVTGSYENKMSNESWEEYLANETPEQKSRRYDREVKDGVREASTPAKPATEGSFERETEYKPELTEGRDADKVDTFYPWEARFARRTQRASVRDEKRRGRRAERDLNRALNKGVIDQEEYDAEIGSARRMRYGQGNIAQRQIGIDGGIEGTEGFDAITSQGYQANRRNTLRTDMDRRPQGEQKAGMPVKADGTEDMSQAEYEAGGKQAKVNVAPKTSPRIQAESKGAETLAKVDMTKPADAMSKAKEFDLRDLGGVDAKAPMGSEAPSKPQKSSSTEMFGEKPSGPVGGKGIESDPMSGIKAPGSFNTNEQADEIFGDDGVVVRDSRGVVGGKGLETDPMAGIEASTPSEPKKMNDTYGIDINDAASDALEEDLSTSRSAFKMKYKHSPAMMYKKGSPAKMWGPSKKASAGKTTGAQNIDNNTTGRPVTQNVTRSAKGIVTGKLNQSSGFKMKGFGNGKK